MNISEVVLKERYFFAKKLLKSGFTKTDALELIPAGELTWSAFPARWQARLDIEARKGSRVRQERVEAEATKRLEERYTLVKLLVQSGLTLEHIKTIIPGGNYTFQQFPHKWRVELRRLRGPGAGRGRKKRLGQDPSPSPLTG